MVSPLLNAGMSETWAPGGAAFPTQGPWAGSLLFTGLRELTLYRAIIDSANPSIVERLERHFAHQFGRLRDIVEGPDKALYLLTSNRDGRGGPGPQDDRVPRLTFK
jgi:glucose/arabinose dehydrogenase